MGLSFALSPVSHRALGRLFSFSRRSEHSEAASRGSLVANKTTPRRQKTTTTTTGSAPRNGHDASEKPSIKGDRARAPDILLKRIKLSPVVGRRFIAAAAAAAAGFRH